LIFFESLIIVLSNTYLKLSSIQFGVMQTADVVAKKAVDALFKNDAECIPGWLNKLTVISLPWIPSFVIEMINRHSNILQKGNKALG
jgi:short-subunit dehydrogenase